MTKRKQQTINNNNLKPLPLYPKTDNQASFLTKFDSEQHHLLLGYPGTGKAQPLYSKILTPNGWKQMGDLKVGDTVRSVNSWTQVTAIYPQGLKETIRLHFKDGSHTDCCEEHLWTINSNVNKNGNKTKNKKLTTTTKEIMRILDVKKVGCNVSLNLPQNIEYPEQSFVIHPYVMGAILGDGSITTTSLALTSIDEEIIKKVQKHLPDNLSLNKRTNSITYGFTDSEATWKNKSAFTQTLIDYSLLGKKSEHKHIPLEYLQSSIEQRYELLQGLMDTDGTVSKKTGAVSFSTSSKELAKNVKELVLSLSGKASITEKHPVYTHKGKKLDGQLSYIVSMNLPDKTKCFSLTRKKQYVSTTDTKQLRRVFSHYEKLDFTEMQCISVKDSTHLYVTDDYLLTHNTYLSLHAAFLDLFNYPDQYKKVIIIRSTIQAQDQGHLPGTKQEKMEPFESPYKTLVTKIFGRGDAYQILKEKGLLEFESISFLRGETIDNALVVFDEFQNATASNAETVLTRIGQNSKLLICGDIHQRDLTKAKELDVEKFLEIVEQMSCFEHTYFDVNDIVRSGMVKEYIKRKIKAYPQGF